MENKYIIGAVLYDEEEELFYCKIARNNKEKELLFTVWSKTEQEVRDHAKVLIMLLA